MTEGIHGVVCCLVGADQYALRGVDVRSVGRAEQIRPGTTRHAGVGVLQQHGQSVPVYSLAALLTGDPGEAGLKRHVVVTGDPDRLFGLLVDQVVRATPDDKTSVLRLPRLIGGQASTWFEGLLPLPEQSCLLLLPAALDPMREDKRPREPSRVSGGTPVPGSRRTDVVADRVVLFSSPALLPGPVRRCALPARRVVAVVQSLPIVPVPGAAPWVAALAWWRDTVVPILDFSGSAGVTTASRRHLVVRCGAALDGALVALAVDADIVLHRATVEDRQVEGGGDGAITRGVFRVGDSRAALLDLDAVIAAAETRNGTAPRSF